MEAAPAQPTAAAAPAPAIIDKDLCEQVALLSIGTDVAAKRADIAKEMADAELALQKAKEQAPIDWRAELAKIEADTMRVTEAFVVKGIRRMHEKRVVEESMPKTEEGWQELCYKILNPTQIELLKKNYKESYESLFKHLRHSEKAFLTNFSNVDWVDPQLSSDFQDRFLADIMCAGVGYDWAAIIARQENHAADEESFSIYVARNTSRSNECNLVNARAVIERRGMLDDADLKKEAHKVRAYLKQLQTVAFNRSGSGVFRKPNAVNMHGKYVSLMWHGGESGHADELSFYELPNCLASDVLTFELPGGVVRHYDLYWPYLVFSCAANRVADIGFLWTLHNHENMMVFRHDQAKLEGDMIIVVDLRERVWLRARPVDIPVVSLSIFPRQTSDLDRSYPPEQLRILWNMSSLGAVANSKRVVKQYSKKLDEEAQQLEGLTSCEYLLDIKDRQADLDEQRGLELFKQEYEELRKAYEVMTAAAAADPKKNPTPSPLPSLQDMLDSEDRFPRPNRDFAASTACARLWKTAEQELKEKQRTGHSFRTRPDEPATRVFQYHCNTVTQWSVNNLSTLVPAHRPYYKGAELYHGRESAPIDRACYGIMCVTLDQDYKLRFSATRAPQANSALQTTSLFDLVTSLPMSEPDGITPPQAFIPKRPRPQGKQPSYKAIYTSLDKVTVLFPCGTLVFFTPMPESAMESHTALLERLKKAKAQEEYIAEMTERKVREALKEEGVAKAEHIGLPEPMDS